jgi:predicted metalloprotease
MAKRTRLAAVAAVAVVGIVVAGCTQTVSGSPRFAGQAAAQDAPNAHVPIHGTDGSEVDHIAANAIADLQSYWTVQMPKVFGRTYRPVHGGFFSVDPRKGGRIPCAGNASEVRGNAFYCPTRDVVVWDRPGLLTALDKRFGRYTIALVLAHEWGHAIQARTTRPGRTIVVETQADCYAGAFTASAYHGKEPHFHITSRDLDRALAGYLSFSDPRGSAADTTSSHGNAFDRISAFQGGFDSGPAYCASPKNFSDRRAFTEVPYLDPQDQSSRGNSPYGDALKLGSADLAAFWKKALPGLKPPRIKGYDPHRNPPSCGGTTVDESVSYCAADNTIYYDGTTAFPKLYRSFGDFSIETLLATAYSFAVRDHLHRGVGGRRALLGSICYAGGYVSDVLTRPKAHSFELSPGDLDEAIQALLLGVDNSAFYGLAHTTGFARVNAFQVGVRDGFTACNRDWP